MVKQTMVNYIKKEKYDELYTPPEAIYPLLKYLPKVKNSRKIVYWECTDFGESNITRVLKENGYKVVSSGKLKDGFDFLKYEPNFYFDIIITNPPYSKKTEFLRRAYEYGKPFAFLLPVTTLEGIERGKLFRKYGIQLVVFDRRINFMKNKKSPWFAVAWFCYNLLPRDLIFVEVK